MIYDRKKDTISGFVYIYIYIYIYIYMQGVLLPDRQSLRGASRHENKHYLIGNYGAQTFFVGGRGH